MSGTRGSRSLSPERMGMLESVKSPLCSTVRQTPDGREWICIAGRWLLLDDIDREATDYREHITRF